MQLYHQFMSRLVSVFLSRNCEGKSSNSSSSSNNDKKHEQQLPKYVRRRWPKRENVLSEQCPKRGGIGSFMQRRKWSQLWFFRFASARILFGANECLVLFLWKYPFFLCPKFASPPPPPPSHATETQKFALSDLANEPRCILGAKQELANVPWAVCWLQLASEGEKSSPLRNALEMNPKVQC